MMPPIESLHDTTILNNNEEVQTMQYKNYSKTQPVAQQSKTPTTEKKRFEEHPETKSSIRISKDGKWVIFKVTTTYFKPVSFLDNNQINTTEEEY